MDLTQFIIQFCNKNNISKEKLAKHANLSRSTLYRMMDPNKTPTLLNLTKLAIAMQVHPQYLIKLEWQKYNFSEYNVTPINPLTEPMRWFDSHQDSAHFISETVADGSVVCSGEHFTKMWRLQNTGEKVWKNRKLTCQDVTDISPQQDALELLEDNLNFCLKPTASSVDIPITKPGETVDLAVDFIAPTVPMMAFSYWKMVDENGNICFPNAIGVYIKVHVVSAGAAED